MNGALYPDDEARISIFDHGLVVGDGVFETIKVARGVPFALTRHLVRLARSAAGLGLPEPDLDAIKAGALAVIEASPAVELARLRITVTGGISPLGSERGGEPVTAIAAMAEAKAPTPTVDVTMVPWPRNERGALAGLKTTSYGENVLALAYAAEHGGAEAIFANSVGNLCEGTGSNVFVVQAGRLLTPPLSAGPLAGVTRALVIEWAGAAEEDLPGRGAGHGRRGLPDRDHQGRAAHPRRQRVRAARGTGAGDQEGRRGVCDEISGNRRPVKAPSAWLRLAA